MNNTTHITSAPRLLRAAAQVCTTLFLLSLSGCGGGGGGGGDGGSDVTSFTVSTNAGAGGAINPASATVDSGNTTSFTVTLDSGFIIDSVSGCGGSLSGTTYTTEAIDADCKVSASFSGPPATAAVPDLTFRSVKTFRFSWTDVSDATHYKLLENPDSSSGFTQLGSDIPQGSQTVDHVVPLYARLNAQYILQSCNSIGCTDSSSVAVSGTLVDSIGYVKASNTEAADRFGSSVALSADGNTLAVGADGEASSATDIDGDQADNNSISAGAVYVFSRDSAGVWGGTPAYIKASNTQEDDFFGTTLTLSADGNTLAVGATGEDGAGITGSNNDRPRAGAVYVYRRDAAGDWSDAFYVKASTVADIIDEDDDFGRSVALSADGSTLAVGATGESSSATEIDGDQADDNAPAAGAVYVFNRDGAGVWGGTPTYIKASNAEAEDRFGTSVSLSGDGGTLAVGAHRESSNATGIDGDQTNNEADDSGAVYVFVRATIVGTDSIVIDPWRQEAYIKASNTGAFELFGSAVSLSGNGNTLAVGAIGESSNATGIDGDEGDDSAEAAGAVYVFTRLSTGLGGGDWSQQAYVKASNTDELDEFGGAVSLSEDGNTLAVGAYLESSNATGLGGDQADNPANDAGAVYMFSRDGGSWGQQAYVKASNTREFDNFGKAVSLSGDGGTLAVGADREASSATAIDGDQADNNAPNAGAVYLY